MGQEGRVGNVRGDQEQVLALIQEMRNDYEFATNPKSRFNNYQEEFEGLAAYGLSAKENYSAEAEGRERSFSYGNEAGGSGSKFRRDFTS